MTNRKQDDEARTTILAARETKAPGRLSNLGSPSPDRPQTHSQGEDEAKTQVLSSSNANATAPYPDREPVTASRDVVSRDEGEVVGWLVVVNGPGRGKCREIYNGLNTIGRGDTQRIALNFGDETISRDAHAYLTFDDEAHQFYFQHAGRANLVRVNDAPVLSNVVLEDRDQIRIGKSYLMFVALCGDRFNWQDGATEEKSDA